MGCLWSLIALCDQKIMRRSYHVVASIEINQTMNRILGRDVFVTWPIEIGGILKTGDGGNQVYSTEGDDSAGKCEWLIGFGPGTSATFWAIHCLDDISPVRFPRITLWKRQEIQGLEMGPLEACEQPSLISKVVISRNHLSGPPTMCFVIHLSPYNSLIWSQLYTQISNNMLELNPNTSSEENYLSCFAGGVLHLDGHTGKVLQIAVHPYICDVQLAVSLDSNGLLLFWLLSTISNVILGLPTLLPSWKLCGKHETKDRYSKYTCMRWVSSLLNGDQILLIGYVGGFDCFIIKIPRREEKNVLCHKLCTIPFTSHGPYENVTTDICPIPLPFTCNKPLQGIKFELFGIMMKGFQPMSWEINIHCFDLTESLCECNFNMDNAEECSIQYIEDTFAGKRYYVGVHPCSLQLSDSRACEITSSALACPGSCPSIQQKWATIDDLCNNHHAYIMATGYSDGSMKLWKKNSRPLALHNPCELVCEFVAHQGPVSAICLTDCGQKIATISAANYVTSLSTLNIWNSVHLTESGSFMLEDTLFLDGIFVAMCWLALGNGQLLLGVCLQNEIHVYAQRRYRGLQLLNSGKPLETQIWFRVSFSHISAPIRGFLWGPGASSVVILDNYFCLFSQWLFVAYKKNDIKCHNHIYSEGTINNDVLSAIFTNGEIFHFKDLAVDSDRGGNCNLLSERNMKKHNLSRSLFSSAPKLKYYLGNNLTFWPMLEVVEKLCGSLPVYHPEVLLMNIYSGNWKRAYVALQHFVESLSSNYASERGFSYANQNHLVPQIPISNYFEGHILRSSDNRKFQWNGDSTSGPSSQFQRDSIQFDYNSDFSGSNNMLIASSKKTEISDFEEYLDKSCELGATTNTEKMQILAVMDLLNEISNSQSASVYESLDDVGRRFWVAVRFQQLYFLRRFGRLAPLEELVIDSRLIVWAFHSDCQENLLGSVLPNESSWKEMRTLGIGFWFTNMTQLRSMMEKLARAQYLKKRDPKDCALLYIALNRLQVLAGLFKISKNEKDKPIVGFLSRNFQVLQNYARIIY